MNVTYRIWIFTGFVITQATRRVPHVTQDLLTLPEHLVFDGVRVIYSLVFYVVSCGLLIVCLSFSFLAMALSVCFRFTSLTVPLVSFAPLLHERKIEFKKFWGLHYKITSVIWFLLLYTLLLHLILTISNKV